MTNQPNNEKWKKDKTFINDELVCFTKGEGALFIPTDFLTSQISKAEKRGYLQGVHDTDKIKEYLKSPAHQKVVRKAAVLSAKDQCDTLDTLVRDLTKAGSLPKSEARRRIETYANEKLAKVEKKLKLSLKEIEELKTRLSIRF